MVERERGFTPELQQLGSVTGHAAGQHLAAAPCLRNGGTQGVERHPQTGIRLLGMRPQQAAKMTARRRSFQRQVHQEEQRFDPLESAQGETTQGVQAHSLVCIFHQAFI